MHSAMQREEKLESRTFAYSVHCTYTFLVAAMLLIKHSSVALIAFVSTQYVHIYSVNGAMNYSVQQFFISKIKFATKKNETNNFD